MDIETNKNEFGEQEKQMPRLPAKLLISIVLISFLAGIGGGAVSISYLQRKGLLLAGDNGAQGVNQKVVLAEDSAVIDVVKKASPAVVSIVISKDLNKLPGFSGDPFGDLDPFFPYFGFGERRGQSGPNIQEVGAGSGFLVTSDGTIVTNRHVVSDESASYTVLTNDQKTYEATVLARDPVNDLAILKIDIKDAPTLDFADSSKIEIGQRVIAIGNSLGHYQNTVTTGVVSGIGRSITASGGNDGAEQLEGVIQTDAAINPGNSGGPLLNVAGQVVGINTAIDQQGQLVGFAIPANDVTKSWESFKKSGKITRPYIGVRYVMITKELAQRENLPRNFGALIARGESITDLAIVPGSPADKAGLAENDIVLECDGVKLENSKTLASCVRPKQVGDTVNLKVYHKGEEKSIELKLDESK